MLAEECLADRLELGLGVEVEFVAGFGRGGGERIEIGREEDGGGFAAGLHGDVIVKCEAGESVDGVDPQPGQGEAGLHLGDLAEADDGSAGVDRAGPNGDIGGGQAELAGDGGDVLCAVDHGAEQLLAVGVGLGRVGRLHYPWAEATGLCARQRREGPNGLRNRGSDGRLSE